MQQRERGIIHNVRQAKIKYMHSIREKCPRNICRQIRDKDANDFKDVLHKLQYKKEYIRQNTMT